MFVAGSRTKLGSMAKMSRGLRNLNPGNIRLGSFLYRGERARSSDSAFRQFEAIEWGYRAMFVLLHTYAVKHHCRSLRDFVARYAPPSENNTEAYLRRVAVATHLEPDEVISTTDGATMTRVGTFCCRFSRKVVSLLSEWVAYEKISTKSYRRCRWRWW